MPLVLAHRGANKVAPQNTIPAFMKALEFNADGIETDVHLCKDGEIVVCHNYTVDETSNGKGFVDELTLAELPESFSRKDIEKLNESKRAIYEDHAKYVEEHKNDPEFMPTEEELAQLEVLENLITREEAIRIITENE